MNFYNGTAHENIFFSIDKNDGAITKNRGGVFFTTKPVELAFELKKQIPLEASDNSAKSFNFLPNYEKYDVIFCSKKFADYAFQNYLIEYPGFVDRLFTLIPLFNNAEAQEKIGCLGIKKACPPLWSANSYYEFTRCEGVTSQEISKIVSPFAWLVAIDEKIKNSGMNFVRARRLDDVQEYFSEKEISKFRQDGCKFFVA